LAIQCEIGGLLAAFTSDTSINEDAAPHTFCRSFTIDVQVELGSNANGLPVNQGGLLVLSPSFCIPFRSYRTMPHLLSRFTPVPLGVLAVRFATRAHAQEARRAPPARPMRRAACLTSPSADLTTGTAAWRTEKAQSACEVQIAVAVEGPTLEEEASLVTGTPGVAEDSANGPALTIRSASTT
jgi:hypothetical protein